jgi:hypothetical protein
MFKKTIDIYTYSQQHIKVKNKVNVTLRPAVNRQSVHLGSKLRQTHDKIFCFQLNPYSYSPYVTSSLNEKIGLSLMNMLGLSSNVRIAHRACYWKFFLLHYVKVLCQSRLYKADHAYLKYCYASM